MIIFRIFFLLEKWIGKQNGGSVLRRRNEFCSINAVNAVNECEGFLASIPRFCPCWRCQEAFFFYFGANRYPRHHWTVLIYRPMSTFCFVIFFDKKILWWKWFRFKVDWFPSGSRNSLCRRFPRPISEGTKRSRLADVLFFSFLFFFLLEKK